MSDKLLDLHVEPAPRPVRRRWGLVVLVLAVVLTLWAVGKHLATGGLARSEIEAGTASLHVAVVSDDRRHFDQARAHFVDAASVSPVDRYPVFLIRATERIQEGGAGGDRDDAVAAAIAAGDLEAARDAATRLGEDGSQPRIYWERLIDRLALLDESAM